MNHAARRTRLAERLEALDVAALFVTRLVNVRYLTGFSGTNGQLLATREGGVFITDSRYEEQARREVPDLRRVINQRLEPAFAEACRDERVARVGFEASTMSFRTWRELDDLEGMELVPVDGEIEGLRWAKEPAEIARIERAQAIADDAFERVIRKIAEGMTERQLAVELELSMRELGADAPAFPTIAAFGENAAEPHHHAGDRPLRRGDVVKLDFGALVDGYHSDMTRTAAFGEVEPQLREIHEVVLRAHRAGVAEVRAGVVGAEPDEAARAVIRDAGYGSRFGHSLGHGVGLEIHEGPSLRPRGEDVLPEGAVVTVEPGIYVPGLGGVRIEDMVVVEPAGARPLPRSPRELIVL